MVFLTAVAMWLTATPTAFAETGIQTVLATGVGSSVEGASKNAADNALTQVVGTFIDTEKQIEKRSEIRAGVQSLTKTIDTRMSEFSQGSIASFRTLEVTQEDGLTRVAAPQRNATSAHDILLQKILMPALSGEVSELRTAEPLVYAQLDPEFQQSLNIRPDMLSPTTILIPVEIRLQQGFIETARDAFENIAADRERIYTNADHCSSRLPQGAYQNRGMLVGVHSFNGTSDLYLFTDVINEEQRNEDEWDFSLRKQESWRLYFFASDFAGFIIRNHSKLPQLRLRRTGQTATIIPTPTASMSKT